MDPPKVSERETPSLGKGNKECATRFRQKGGKGRKGETDKAPGTRNILTLENTRRAVLTDEATERWLLAPAGASAEEVITQEATKAPIIVC